MTLTYNPLEMQENGQRITEELLQENGWNYNGGFCWHTETIEGNKVRVGWRNGEFILGYGLFPRRIWLVSELNAILHLAGFTMEIQF